MEEAEAQQVGVHFLYNQLPTPACVTCEELEPSQVLQAVSSPF